MNVLFFIPSLWKVNKYFPVLEEVIQMSASFGSFKFIFEVPKSLKQSEDELGLEAYPGRVNNAI